MGYENLHSAASALEGLTASPYSIFDHKDEEKDVLLWQPSAIVDSLHQFPQPRDLRGKAESFLKTASEVECGIAAAPEWGYNLQWATDHSELLVGPESPFYVLGCAPVDVDEIEPILSDLEERFEIFTAEEMRAGDTERTPAGQGKLFVTPTIIPIKAAARPTSDRDALLVQFKNRYMSARANSAEQKHLAPGNGVWRIDPSNTRTEVLAWTCSDLLEGDLCESAMEFAQQEEAIIVHVQCNPKPFHDSWTQFRAQIFDTRLPVTYLNANWGTLFDTNPQKKPTYCGYSGAFTKTEDYTTLSEGFNRTCRAGGLAGVNTEQHYEYVCSLPADSISKVRFNRMNPARSPPKAPAMSDVQIITAWSYTDDTYTEDSEMPACELPEQPSTCTEWRTDLNQDPVNEELIAGLLRGEVTANTNGSAFIPHEHLTWNTIESFTAMEGESFAPLLRNHQLRDDPKTADGISRRSPGRIAYDLKTHLEYVANEKDIVLDDRFSREKTPINATYRDRLVPIQLSLLETAYEGQEEGRAKWLYDWYEIMDRKFKPVVIVDQPSSPAVFKTLDGYEDVTGPINNPERVDRANGLTELKE